MKNRRIWIFLSSILLLIIFVMTVNRSLRSTKVARCGEISDRSLEYFLGEDCPQISLHPIDQDFVTNLTISQHLIGTLLSFGQNEHFEPFLAEKWEELDDGRKYRFWLKKGVKAEDGTPLTAFTFKQGLLLLLRIHSEKEAPTDFDLLKGWSEFSHGASDLVGIQTPSDLLIEFHFSRRPLGLLKYLSLPKFGFVVPRDFSSDGKWINPHNVTSTGPYRLADFSDERKVVLVRRADFFPESKGMERVTVWRKDLPNEACSRRIAFFRKPVEDARYQLMQFIAGPPVFLSVLSLSHKIGPFQNREFRRVFRDRIQSVFLAKLQKNPIPGVIPVRNFYLQPVSQYEPMGVAHLASGDSSESIKIFHPKAMNSHELGLLRDLMEFAFEGSGFKYQMVVEDRSDPEWLNKLHSYEHYDVRWASVATGGDFIPWVVKMMFCGRLGIGFPDVNGRVCRLVNGLSESDLRDASALERASHTFEEIIRDEAQTIPLFYSGISWYATPDLDLSRYSSVSYYPRFDYIEPK